MSGGGPHVCDSLAPKAASQPSSSIVESSGDLDVPGSVSAPPAPLLVRGGANPSFDLAPLPPPLPLPSVALPLSAIEQFPTLSGAFAVHSGTLPPSSRFVDCFGGGNCFFNCVGVGLVATGRIFPASEGDPLAGLASHAPFY